MQALMLFCSDFANAFTFSSALDIYGLQLIRLGLCRLISCSGEWLAWFNTPPTALRPFPGDYLLHHPSLLLQFAMFKAQKFEAAL
jgi:hypothetical protein